VSAGAPQEYEVRVATQTPLELALYFEGFDFPSFELYDADGNFLAPLGVISTDGAPLWLRLIAAADTSYIVRVGGNVTLDYRLEVQEFAATKLTLDTPLELTATYTTVYFDTPNAELVDVLVTAVNPDGNLWLADAYGGTRAAAYPLNADYGWQPLYIAAYPTLANSTYLVTVNLREQPATDTPPQLLVRRSTALPLIVGATAASQGQNTYGYFTVATAGYYRLEVRSPEPNSLAVMLASHARFSPFTRWNNDVATSLTTTNRIAVIEAELTAGDYQLIVNAKQITSEIIPYTITITQIE
jgi:hypothetical protein